MKKIICTLLLVMLCACSGERAVQPQMRGVSFIAAIQNVNGQYECDVAVDENCSVNIAINKPAELAGLKFNCSENGITAELLGLSYSPNLDTMPSGAMISCVYGILKDCTRDNLHPQKDNGNYILRSKLGEHNYTLLLSPSGLPICAEIPNLNFKMDFQNVTVAK